MSTSNIQLRYYKRECLFCGFTFLWITHKLNKVRKTSSYVCELFAGVYTSTKSTKIFFFSFLIIPTWSSLHWKRKLNSLLLKWRQRKQFQYSCSVDLLLQKHASTNILKILQPKKGKSSDKKFWYFSYFCSKHRLCVLVRRVPTIYVFLAK